MSTYEAAINLTSSSPLPAHPVAYGKQSSTHKDDDDFLSSSQGVSSAYFKPAESGTIRSPPSFTTARNVLGTRSSAENVPIYRSQPKFKLTPQSISPVKRPSHFVAPKGSPAPKETGLTGKTKHDTTEQRVSSHWDAIDDGEPVVIKIMPSDVRRKKKDDDLSSLLAKAVARRNDWTPPKAGAAGHFSFDLAAAFAHKDEQPFARTGNEDGSFAKRRKIEMESQPICKPSLSRKSSGVVPRSKSPVKKGLTITALATSNFEDKKDKESPMAQYLISTQSRQHDDPMMDNVQVKMNTKKPKTKAKVRSRLVSPGTAQKDLNSQDLMFATASQLARDDSPTILKQTIEAMKLSEEDHDYFSTQQDSQLTACPSSPAKSDLSRHVGRRRLWAEGQRNEDGTLIHEDDDLELPNLNDFIAHNDGIPAALPTALPVSMDSMSLLRTLNKGAAMVLDEIADGDGPEDNESSPAKAVKATPKSQSQIRAPPKFVKPQVRELSTSHAPSSKRTQQTSQMHTHPQLNDITQPKLSISPRFINPEQAIVKQKPPPKPNYALWTDERLKEECQALGIKRVRVRTSFIEKLDEHWAQKYGLDPAKVKAAQKQAGKEIKRLQQVDLLGKALDFADRPAPAKPRKPRRKKEKGIVVSRSTKEVFDINDVDTSCDRLQAMDIPQDSGDDSLSEVDLSPSTAPVKGTGVKGRPQVVQLTPPPTKSSQVAQESSPGFEVVDSPLPAKQASTLPINMDDSIKSRILPALLKQPADMHSRNQQSNPTWHQKVLMYDPIVLEDFTVWLNTEGFNNINEDGEIDAQTVKDWCTENGVCCLWKGGWRGNKKKGKAE